MQYVIQHWLLRCGDYKNMELIVGKAQQKSPFFRSSYLEIFYESNFISTKRSNDIKQHENNDVLRMELKMMKDEIKLLKDKPMNKMMEDEVNMMKEELTNEMSDNEEMN